MPDGGGTCKGDVLAKVGSPSGVQSIGESTLGSVVFSPKVGGSDPVGTQPPGAVAKRPVAKEPPPPSGDKGRVKPLSKGEGAPQKSRPLGDPSGRSGGVRNAPAKPSGSSQAKFLGAVPPASASGPGKTNPVGIVAAPCATGWSAEGDRESLAGASPCPMPIAGRAGPLS